jgi:hypothetical protein
MEEPTQTRFIRPPGVTPIGKPPQLIPLEDTQAIEDLLGYKILIHSLSGVGKTCFLRSIQEVTEGIILDAERGTLAHTGRIIRLENWDHFVKVVDALVKRNHPYQVVSIDTVDALYNMAWNHTLNVLSITHPVEASHGRGYDRITSTLFSQLNKLQLSGLGLVCAAHTMTNIIKIRNIEYTNYAPSLVGGSPRSAYQRIQDFFDIIGFLHMESMVKPEKDVRTHAAASQITEVESRVLEFQPSKFWVTKNRVSGRFKEPIVLPNDWKQDWEIVSDVWNYRETTAPPPNEEAELKGGK